MKQEGEEVYVPLWSEADRKARNADIDWVEICEGGMENCERTVNAMVNTLQADFLNLDNETTRHGKDAASFNCHRYQGVMV